jgi:electron transfer flavoprotein alpha subunit
MSAVIVIIEHDRGELASASLEALSAARPMAAQLGVPVVGAVCGASATSGGGAPDIAAVIASCAEYGASETVVLEHALLGDFGPEAWGDAVAQLVAQRAPVAVLASGTDRGNEVMAHVAAILDAPMVANCLSISPSTAASTEPWTITRVQWGGSLLEDSTLNAAVKLVTVTHHGFEATAAPAVAFTTSVFQPTLDASLARTVVADRVVREAGVTLTTARVVVGGGRGVGSPEGFGILEELAAELNGKVGCSRAVTNNGWRNHADQVGQTGTRIAPDIYLACGISGAIQHWVGAMASKNILAINTDREANMVTKADYAVIGDLHKVIPAITAEIRRRR